MPVITSRGNVPVSAVQLCVGGCVCLPAWDGAGTFTGPSWAHLSFGACVQRFQCARRYSPAI